MRTLEQLVDCLPMMSGRTLIQVNDYDLYKGGDKDALAALLSDGARYKFYQYQNMLSMIGMLLLVSGALTGPLSVLENAVYGGVSWLAALPFRLTGVL